MTKRYNNIQDVSTSNLYKMLSLKQFQDDDHQKMIKDEIKFRNKPITIACFAVISEFEYFCWLVFSDM